MAPLAWAYISDGSQLIQALYCRTSVVMNMLANLRLPFRLCSIPGLSTLQTHGDHGDIGKDRL